MQLRIGELAKRSGLTVRTLHHYDAIGLLSPSGRSEGGYRLYGPEDIARLQQIQAIKQLGFSLADVGHMLSGDKRAVAALIRQQRALLDHQIAHAKVLRDGLSVLENQLEHGVEPTLDEWLSVLEMMALYAKYFSPEELRAMRDRKDGVVELSDAGWQRLFGEVTQLMAAGVPESDPRVETLAQEWIARSQRLTGGDVAMMERLGEMHRNEPLAMARSGATAESIEYLRRAYIHWNSRIFEKYLNLRELKRVRANMLAHFGAWPLLVSRVRQQMAQGVMPESPAARALAREWKALFQASYANGDAVLEQKVRAALAAETAWGAERGVDATLLQWIYAAMPATE